MTRQQQVLSALRAQSRARDAIYAAAPPHDHPNNMLSFMDCKLYASIVANVRLIETGRALERLGL